jgi:hypothetical protein
MSSDIIKVVPDFISEEDVVFYIDMINRYEKSNLKDFFPSQEGKRLTLLFGNYENDVKFDPRVQETLALFSKEELDRLRSLFLRINEKIKITYNLDNNLYICSFFLAKQYSGAEVELHTDIDDREGNQHFEHSVILYLNTLEVGGDLTFVSPAYSYKPKKGDLVFFLTRAGGPHYVKTITEDRYSLVFWTTKDKRFELK